MRLFFAIDIPDPIVEQIEAVQSRLRDEVGEDGVRWTRPNQFHLTLKFLGEQNLARAQSAVELATAIAQETLQFEVELAGVGAFPNVERPSVVWLGATRGTEELTELASRLDMALSRRGFARDKNPVRAHLTLARINTYTAEAAAARMLRNPPPAACGVFQVSRISLVRSTLSPTGSLFDQIREFPLIER